MYPLGEQALSPVKQARPVRVIAVNSGKGGVGKTSVAVNIALAMIQLGRRTMLFDADLGLANVDVMLGLRPRYNLSQVINGERTLDEVIVQSIGGLQVIPASSGMQHMAHLNTAQHAGLVRAFSELDQKIDALIVDTAAGIHESVTLFSRAAQEIIVVVCNEPASITDAYALIKVLSRDFGQYRFHVLANMTQSVQEGKELYGKLVKTTDRFLDVALDYIGVVPFDEYVKKAIQRQKAVVDAYPRSRAAVAFKNLAQKADNWPVPTTAAGHLEFFVERLIEPSFGNGG